MKKLSILILAISLLGCSAVGKVKQEAKDWANVGLVNKEVGSVFVENGKTYFVSENGIKEIDIKDVGVYIAKTAIQ